MARDAPTIVGSYWTLAGDAQPPPGDGPEWSPLDLRDRVETAARVGFGGMGLWHADVERVTERYTLEEVRALLDANGIEHVELEFVEYPHLDPGHPGHDAMDDRLDRLLELAATLDAHHVKLGNIEGSAVPLPALRELLADLAERAEAVDTAVGLEVITADPNLRAVEDALSVVDGIPNAGLILDTWHVVKMGLPYEAVASIPADALVGVELNDGYLETDMTIDEETTGYRRLPGEGEYDVAGFVDAVRETGYDGPWGVEVLSKELRRLPMEEAYRRAYDRTVEVLGRASARAR